MSVANLIAVSYQPSAFSQTQTAQAAFRAGEGISAAVDVINVGGDGNSVRMTFAVTPAGGSEAKIEEILLPTMAGKTSVRVYTSKDIRLEQGSYVLSATVAVEGYPPEHDTSDNRVEAAISVGQPSAYVTASTDASLYVA
ncbi:MAG: hypothetical protein HY814_12395, partial [Candidatus Riflebacteria bacterium]|nr:hypothetical protein [Candidatus Riflebacteria bacterium]